MAESLTKSDVVSFEAESLILVDAEDRVLGYLDKSACHDGEGVLHRAFSLFIFNSHGELLMQQRAPGKRLWPGYWANSCCSHPRRGEEMTVAVERRLEQELGLETDLEYAYKFEYTANYQGLGTEHELCHVFIGHTDAAPVINTTEIQDWQWIAPAELSARLAADDSLFTPWLKLEWARLTSDFPHLLP